MLSFLSQAMDRFLGRGDASIAIPTMDGMLKPNDRLDEAQTLFTIERPDNLLQAGDRVFFSADRKLMAVGEDWAHPETIFEAGGDILATALAPDGRIAVFEEQGGLWMLDLSTNMHVNLAVPQVPAGAVTAAAFRDEHSLLVCLGSVKNGVAQWQRDLLDSEAAGSVWAVDVRSGDASPIAEKLGYPAGCLVLFGGSQAVVSESWKNRLLLIDLEGRKSPEPLLTTLPGYPSRMSSRSGGGVWLSLFAPRNQLIEFVRRERGYRQAMMAEVPREFWVAPMFASGRSFNEPMQGGALKQMGILKPWAPTLSYGLVVELSADFIPIASYHSRAGGRRHGINSTIETGSRLIVASKGGGAIVSLERPDSVHDA